MKKILLIWDFDGVIADSEQLWVKIWYETLIKTKNIRLSKEEVQKYLVGMSAKTKQQILNERFGPETIDETFLHDTNMQEKFQIEHVLSPIDGVEKIFSDDSFVHCVATGTVQDLAVLKLKRVGLWKKYIDEKNCFTSDMVQNGKPAPDLFLLAASSMGYDPQDCVVIEDSVHGIHAALAAKMAVIAFIGAENNNTQTYADVCLKEGASQVFNNMKDLHLFLKKQNRRLDAAGGF